MNWIVSKNYIAQFYGVRSSAEPLEGGMFQGVLTVQGIKNSCEHRHRLERTAIECAERDEFHALKRLYKTYCRDHNIVLRRVPRSRRSFSRKIHATT